MGCAARACGDDDALSAVQMFVHLRYWLSSGPRCLVATAHHEEEFTEQAASASAAGTRFEESERNASLTLYDVHESHGRTKRVRSTHSAKSEVECCIML